MNNSEILTTAAKAINTAVDEVRAELARAQELHRPFASSFEGWAVVRVELDELWDEIKRRVQEPGAIRSEALQVAAMCARYLLDVEGLDTEDVFGDLHALLQDLPPRASAHEAYGYLHFQLSDSWRDHRSAMVEAVRLMIHADRNHDAQTKGQRA